MQASRSPAAFQVPFQTVKTPPAVKTHRPSTSPYPFETRRNPKNAKNPPLPGFAGNPPPPPPPASDFRRGAEAPAPVL